MVADNSGGKYVKCIRIISSKIYLIGTVGDLLLTRVIKKKHSKKIKKKELYYGLITMVKQYVQRIDGTIVKFNDNRVVLFSNTNKFLGSRIYGPLMKEIRFYIHRSKKEKQKYLKIVSYASAII